jgi:hypothetical protein
MSLPRTPESRAFLARVTPAACAVINRAFLCCCSTAHALLHRARVTPPARLGHFSRHCSFRAACFRPGPAPAALARVRTPPLARAHALRASAPPPAPGRAARSLERTRPTRIACSRPTHEPPARPAEPSPCAPPAARASPSGLGPLCSPGAHPLPRRAACCHPLAQTPPLLLPRARTRLSSPLPAWTRLAAPSPPGPASSSCAAKHRPPAPPAEPPLLPRRPALASRPPLGPSPARLPLCSRGPHPEPPPPLAPTPARAWAWRHRTPLGAAACARRFVAHAPGLSACRGPPCAYRAAAHRPVLLRPPAASACAARSGPAVQRKEGRERLQRERRLWGGKREAPGNG